MRKILKSGRHTVRTKNPYQKKTSRIAVKKYAIAYIKTFWSCQISLHFITLFQYFVQHLIITCATSLKLQYFDVFGNFKTLLKPFYTNGKQPSCRKNPNLTFSWNQYLRFRQKLPLKSNQILSLLVFPIEIFYFGHNRSIFRNLNHY